MSLPYFPSKNSALRFRIHSFTYSFSLNIALVPTVPPALGQELRIQRWSGTFSVLVKFSLQGECLLVFCLQFPWTFDGKSETRKQNLSFQSYKPKHLQWRRFFISLRSSCFIKKIKLPHVIDYSCVKMKKQRPFSEMEFLVLRVKLCSLITWKVVTGTVASL